MRPVPVVRLRMDFWPHWSAQGKHNARVSMILAAFAYASSAKLQVCHGQGCGTRVVVLIW
jgi:hypothetical protein